MNQEQKLAWDCLLDVPVTVPLYSHGEFTVCINGVNYKMRASTYRDGRSYDDPVFWEDIAIYDENDVLFKGDNDFSELIYDKIAEILDTEYDELAGEIEAERDIDRHHDYDWGYER